MTIFMKKTITLFFSLFLFTSTFAVTEQEAREYYKKCIANLDPIEGVYSVEFRGNGATILNNAWVKESKTSILPDVYIVKMSDKRDGRYLVCFGNTAENDWESYVVLENIGNSNAYKFMIFDAKHNVIASCQTTLSKSGQFTAIIDNGKIAQNNSYGMGTQTTIQFNFIKSYPTHDMYVESGSASESSQGTAFALRDNYIVTNYHVYGGNKYSMVKASDNKFYRAYYVTGDESNDIAIFQIRDEDFSELKDIPYTIANEDAEIGEAVWTMGYPMTHLLGEEIKYTKGEISSLSGSSSDGENLKTNDTRYYQISTPISHGNSGGPLFDETGNIVGITSSGWSNDVASNANYAIKSQLLLSVLKSAGLNKVCPQKNVLKGQKQKEQIKLAKPYIMRIICYNSKAIENELLNAKEIVQETESSNYTSTQREANDSRTMTARAVEDTLQILSRIDKTYYLGEKKLTEQEYKDILKTDKSAWGRHNNKCIKVGIALDCIGGAFMIGGGICAGIGTAAKHNGALKIDGGDTYAAGIAVLCIGVPILVGGGIVTLIGFHLRSNAYQVYNKSAMEQNERKKNAPDRYINLQLCQDGIGIGYVF